MVTPMLAQTSNCNSTRRLPIWGRAILASALALAVVPAVTVLAEPIAGANSRDRGQVYLGVEFRDISEEQVGALHLSGRRGVEITMVDHDGPAGKAGLRPHDILLQMNGQNIENEADLRHRIRESSPGMAISLFIMRQGKAITVTAQLANREEVERQAWEHMSVSDPEPGDGPAVSNILIERYTVEAAPTPKTAARGQSFIGTVLRTVPFTGASVQPMSPQLAGYFGAPPKTGLLVHAVEPNSPAAFAGLQAGDVVMSVDASPVASNSDWSKRLRASSGRAVSLTILRDKHERTITMQPDLKRHSLLEWPKLF